LVNSPSDRSPAKECLEPEVIDALLKYSWPGNVRELRSVIEHAFIFMDGDRLTRKDIRLGTATTDDKPLNGYYRIPIGLSMEKIKMEVICQMVEFVGRNRPKAGVILNIAQSTMLEDVFYAVPFPNLKGVYNGFKNATKDTVLSFHDPHIGICCKFTRHY